MPDNHLQLVLQRHGQRRLPRRPAAHQAKRGAPQEPHALLRVDLEVQHDAADVDGAVADGLQVADDAEGELLQLLAHAAVADGYDVAVVLRALERDGAAVERQPAVCQRVQVGAALAVENLRRPHGAQQAVALTLRIFKTGSWFDMRGLGRTLGAKKRCSMPLFSLSL